MLHVRTLSLTLLLLLAGALSANVQAQARRRNEPLPPAADASRASNGVPNREEPFGSPHEELLERAAIKFDESEHKETLERAKEGALLGVELRAGFEQNRALTREDWKKIERLEKIARRIRSRVGGSDDKTPLEDPPGTLEKAIPRLALVADELQKGVEKTSRHVISAAVIERSNELIELIKLIRQSFSQ